MKELNVGTATALVERWRRRMQGDRRHADRAPGPEKGIYLARARAFEDAADELEALYLPDEERKD